jgi:hypothetical protein
MNFYPNPHGLAMISHSLKMDFLAKKEGNSREIQEEASTNSRSMFVMECKLQ